MAYRLGLDVGTASCGLIAWTLDEQGQPSELAYHSLDIWSEPLLPAKSSGVGEPRNAARRAARMLRRGIYRRARRLRRIAHLASLLGLDRCAVPPDSGQDIHRLRALAAEQRVELADLLRIFLRMAKNRGPSGAWVYAEPELTSGKGKRGKKNPSETALADEAVATLVEADKKAAEEKKGIVGGVRELEKLMREAAQALGKTELTLGQYLHYRRERGESVILGKPDAKPCPLYPSRRMVENEFNRIWDTQAQFHPVMRDRTVRDQFFGAIFAQRPLKSPAPMVGRCPLEPTLPRAPAAQMAAQAFRIEKQIADLRWGMGKRAQPLSPEQKAIVRELLNSQGEVAFSTIREALDKAGHPGPPGCGLNMERSSRESLKGNTTLAVFRKLGLDAEWNALDEKTQVQVINFLADLGSPDALDSDDWHLNFETVQKDPATGKRKKREFSTAMVAFVNHLRQRPKFGRLSSMGFDGGRMAYSIKALKKLTELMQEQGLDERAAAERAYADHFKAKPLSCELPLPPETGNTVVDVALRQVYRAVDRAMKALDGPPSQVIVELSRDMALGIKKRSEIETKINVNNKARREAAQAIAEHGEQVTDKKIDRYLLWEQQMHYCPYCDRRIELGEALGSETEREHILPRALTRVGGKRSQLVLAHRTCNQQKGNRTPWQAFGNDEALWRIIETRAEQLREKKQFGKARLLLLKDWEEEVLDDKAIQDFTDRQFHEGSWIAKLTAQWLRTVCADVAVSRGELTAHLRRIWKLDTVIPEVRFAQKLPVLDREGKPISEEEFRHHKLWWEGHGKEAGGIETERKPNKRIDHRHHLVDALVISLTDRKLFQKMAENYKQEREKERRGERAKLSLYEAPPIPSLRELAVEIVTNAKIRHKPDRYPDGPLFEQSAYGLNRKPNAEGKQQLAISKPLKALIDNKGSAKKTRKALENIESEVTRSTVLKAFDSRIAAGTSIKQVFDEAILHPQFGTPIRRVRLLGDSEDTATRVVHTNRHGTQLEKRYPHAGNAYLEIRVEGNKLVGAPRLVKPLEAMREKGLRPPTGVRRFWKKDTISYNGARYIIGKIISKNGGTLCLVPVTETCTHDELPHELKKSVSGKSLASVTIIDV